MNLCYWGMIKEEVFNDWLRSFDIDIRYRSSKTNHISGNKEYELLSSEYDLTIKWSVSNKEYSESEGGSITKITLATYENGFSHKSKFILIEKIDKGTIRQVSSIYEERLYNNGDLITSELSLFMFKLNPDLKSKLRDKKINQLFDDNH
jgi:hypothetical protein